MLAATAAGDVGARQIAPHHVYDSSRLENPVTRELRELWARRRLLRFLVARDMTLRYKRSVLGVWWTLLCRATAIASVTSSGWSIGSVTSAGRFPHRGCPQAVASRDRDRG